MFYDDNTEESRGKTDLDDVVITPIKNENDTLNDDNSALVDFDIDELIKVSGKEPELMIGPAESFWGEYYDIAVLNTKESENVVLHRCDICQGYFIDKELYIHGCVITPSDDDLPDILDSSSKNIQNALTFSDKPFTGDLQNSVDTKKTVTVKKHPRNKKQSKKIPGSIRWMRRVKTKKPKAPTIKVQKPRKPGISERTLTDVGPYICHICNKTLRRQSYLTIHMRRHNKEKPFACDHCKKKFVVQYDLDRHMRIHITKKTYSYPCDICLKPFVTQSGLKLHKEQLHNTCEYCGVTFKGKSQLNLHKMTHKEDQIAVGLFQPQRDELQLNEKDLT